MDSLAKNNFRSELKDIDWDFPGENGMVGFAAYHWYPARYVPQVPGILINYFSEPGETVLDPFCGSGTTLVEAFRFGRRAVGIDLNPIAVLMTKAKLLPYNEESFTSYANVIVGETRDLLAHLHGSLLHSSRVIQSIPNYEENRAWYHKDTLRELGSIWTAIHEHSDSMYFLVGCAAFSSILKYCNSQNKHWGWVCDNVKPKHKIYKNALTKFTEKLIEYKSCAKTLQHEAVELQDKKIPIQELNACQGDCTEVLGGFPDKTIDLVVSSPPYFSMTDYISSQRLSFLWFDSDANTLRSNEIGARYKRFRKNPVEEYLQMMSDSFRAVARVLKDSRFCCTVIGESPRHEPFLDKFETICADVGLRLVESLARKIPKQRTLSPILHHERILIMKKEDVEK